MSGVRHVTVAEGDAGMRLDRWLRNSFGLPQGRIQKMLRKGLVRVDGRRADAAELLAFGAVVRIPPEAGGERPPASLDAMEGSLDFMRSLIIHEDDAVIVINKPPGLAVQGGSGIAMHVEAMAAGLRRRESDDPPRLVHRIDRETSGVLLLARTRRAAAELGRAFRTSSVRKIYHALVSGVPRPAQGQISCFLAKVPGMRPDGPTMQVAAHGDEGARHSLSHYAVIDRAGQTAALVSLKPVTGRTHQLRVHMNRLGTPIIGDPRYFPPDRECPQGLAPGLHLHARRITIPHPGGGMLDITAPLPPHFLASLAALGLRPPAADEPDMD